MVNMVKKKLYIYSNVLALIIGLIFCYLTYGFLGLPIAIVTQLLLGIILLAGFIPIIGVFVYIWLAWFNVLPWIVSVFGVEWAWSLSVLFVFNLVVSIGCTAQAIIRIFTTYYRI